jgi:DNA invertase Pin-like site-specific DNA recombinase
VPTRKHRRRNVGAANPTAKLCADLVRAMRAGLRAGVSQRSLARIYGVSRANVYLIAHRKTWRRPVARKEPPMLPNTSGVFDDTGGSVEKVIVSLATKS